MITGTRGALTVPSLEICWHEPGQGWGQALTRKRIPYIPEDAYIARMRDFAQVITGKAAPIVSGEEDLRTLAATLAISASAATGQPVCIADLLEKR
ncbi:MAG: hypothetical protein ACKVQT_37470 [Burkholderiales bacterium]